MAMKNEFEYYAARSGLPAGNSLESHQRAYWVAQLGLSAAQAFGRTNADLEWLFYRVNALDTQAWYSLADLRLRYFQTASGLPSGKSVSEYQTAVFALPNEIITITSSPPNPVSDAAVAGAMVVTAELSTPTAHVLDFIQRLTPGGAGTVINTFGAIDGDTKTVSHATGGNIGTTKYYVAKHNETGVVSNEIAITVVA